MQIKINKEGELYCDSSINLGIFGIYDDIEIETDYNFEDITESEKINYLEDIN